MKLENNYKPILKVLLQIFLCCRGICERFMSENKQTFPVSDFNYI